jgi:hypothetical protein
MAAENAERDVIRRIFGIQDEGNVTRLKKRKRLGLDGCGEDAQWIGADELMQLRNILLSMHSTKVHCELEFAGLKSWC